MRKLLSIAAFLSLFLPLSSFAYSKPPVSPLTPYYASSYGSWQMPVTIGNASTGLGFVYVLSGSVVIPGGRQISPFNTNAALTIDGGANQETFTPTTITGCVGFLSCQIFGTFTKIHGQGAQVISGTGGLQEAINDATQNGGGNVLVDNTWTGSTAMITGAAGNTNVSITDNRTGSALYTWTGSAYAVATSGGLPCTSLAYSLQINNAGTFGCAGSNITGQVPQFNNNGAPTANTPSIAWEPSTNETAIQCDSGTSILAGDRNKLVPYTATTSVTVPQAGSSGCGTNFAFKTVAECASCTVTFTPTTSTITVIDGSTYATLQTSVTMTGGQSLLWSSPDNSNWFVIKQSGGATPASGAQYALTQYPNSGTTTGLGPVPTTGFHTDAQGDLIFGTSPCTQISGGTALGFCIYEGTQPLNGSTTGDVIWADSVAQRLKMVNHNGTATPIAGLSDFASPPTAGYGSTTPEPVAATSLKGSTFNSTTNCAAAGSAASPSLVACSAAPSGSFSCATNASTATCVISTTAVTANSRIFVQPSVAEGSNLSVTCNTSSDTGLTAPRLASKSAATSFTINLGTFTTNPVCFNYWVVN